jgi:hypothetical protein
MRKLIAVLLLFASTSLIGCDDAVGEYVAASSISSSGLAKRGFSRHVSDGQTIKVWGYVDHGNSPTDRCTTSMRDDPAEGVDPPSARWRFKLKARANDSAGESFAARRRRGRASAQVARRRGGWAADQGVRPGTDFHVRRADQLQPRRRAVYGFGVIRRRPADPGCCRAVIPKSTRLATAADSARTIPVRACIAVLRRLTARHDPDRSGRRRVRRSLQHGGTSAADLHAPRWAHVLWRVDSAVDRPLSCRGTYAV